MVRVLLYLIGLLLLAVMGPIVGGQLRQYEQTPAGDLEQFSELGGVSRSDHRFRCGDAVCAGTLYMPRDAHRPPLIVMAGGFAGTQDVALPAFAVYLAQSGYAVLTFDYRFFGQSGGAPRQLVNPWKQLEDWSAATEYAASLKETDNSRIAVVGASLGGGHALIEASRNDAVRAVVALVPLTDTQVEGEATFFGAEWLARLLYAAWSDLWLAAFDNEPVLIPVISKQGGFGMLVDDNAYSAFERLTLISKYYRNEVLARSIFTFDDYNPAVQARRLTKPALIVASKVDRFAAFPAAEEFVSKQKQRQLFQVRCDHFEVYSPPCFDVAAAATLHFLQVELAAQKNSH